MKIELIRTKESPEHDSVFGELYVNSQYECVSLERLSVMIREGTYPISLYFSPHFQRRLPLLDVPGREYIEIHPANWAYQLKGCVAPGMTSNQDSISNSLFAFNRLMNKIQEAIDTKGEKVNISVKSA